MIYYIGSACVGVVFFVGICYWAVTLFVKQCTERTFAQFRRQVAGEAELALKLFREGMCEQIVLQENKSDCLAKLYATLIDLLQLGKDFTSGLGKRDLEMASRKIQSIREMCDLFAATFQKQSLHFSDELCTTLASFVDEQKRVVQFVEANWNLTHKDPAENEKREAAIRQSWVRFEDHITSAMETLRTEFRGRQPAGNFMMKWLKEIGGQGAGSPSE